MSIQSIAKVLEFSKARMGARLVLLSIANHDGDGGSWPTIATIRQEAGLSETAVHEGITRAQALGELIVHRNEGGTAGWRGDRRPNRYELVLNGVVDSAPREGDGVRNPGERGADYDANGVPESAPKPSIEPSTKPSTRAQADSGFLAFWEIYPRRVQKRAALKAYERAVQRADRDPGQAIYSINTGASRLARTRAGKDQKFTPYPATWLNADGWLDEVPRWHSGQPRILNGAVMDPTVPW